MPLYFTFVRPCQASRTGTPEHRKDAELKELLCPEEGHEDAQ